MNWGFWSVVLAIFFFITTIIATIIIAIKFTRKKQPVWAYNTSQVIGIGTDAPSELKLYFGDQQVNDVYRTRLVIFNKGKELIDKSDLVEPISIQFHGCKILRDPTNILPSREKIGFGASRFQNATTGDLVIFQFEYLDHDDGGVIEVLHTKTETEGITSTSNIKGAKEVKCIGEFNPYRPKRFYRRIMATIFGLFLPFGVITGLFLAASASTNTTQNDETRIFVFGVFAIMWIFMLFVFYRSDIRPILNYRKFPRWSAHDK